MFFCGSKGELKSKSSRGKTHCRLFLQQPSGASFFFAIALSGEHRHRTGANNQVRSMTTPDPYKKAKRVLKKHPFYFSEESLDLKIFVTAGLDKIGITWSL